MSEKEENKREKKDLRVVTGDGSLDISPVYEHLPNVKPKNLTEKHKNIVVPKEKKKG